MIVFRYSVVVSIEGEHIALRYVESMSLEKDKEAIVISKLKDDIILNITTVSGKKYSISMLQQILEFFYPNSVGVEEMRSAIVDKWMLLINGKTIS